MYYIRVIFLLFCFCTLNTSTSERILSFISEITVNKDATVDVKESITVVCENRTIIHGIMREFPKRYRDRFGHTYNVHFTLESVQQQTGTEALKSVPVKLSQKANGIVLYIGDPYGRLKRGIYTYVIKYKVNRVLGFFKEYDELYWNVTGNGWRLPIDEAQALVTLPAGTPLQSMVLDAYTGPFGAREKNALFTVSSSGKALFRTTRPLAPYDGLTIAVSWPKGIVQEPSSFKKLTFFLYDNLNILVLLIGLMIILTLYFLAWLDVRSKNRPGTIIPLFKPPFAATQSSEPLTPLLPSEIRFLSRKKYDAQALSAEIVNMAVLGCLTIDYKSGFFKGVYTLQKALRLPSHLHPLHKLILDRLFDRYHKQIELTSYSASLLANVESGIKQWLQTHLQADNLATKTKTIMNGILLSLLVAFIAFLCVPGTPGLGMFVLTGLLIFINAIFATRLVYYTPQGRKLMDQIEGFKLFLETTETPRLEVIGTPPTKTPRLYEQYLPYAMALGVEAAWTKQFTPIFKALRQKGTPYQPSWYYNPRIGIFDAPAFSSNLSRSLSSAISSSVSAPGSSSGSRGGGSSGGGAGGGGGGGW